MQRAFDEHGLAAGNLVELLGRHPAPLDQGRRVHLPTAAARCPAAALSAWKLAIA
jgi:hypothetical protein